MIPGKLSLIFFCATVWWLLTAGLVFFITAALFFAEGTSSKQTAANNPIHKYFASFFISLFCNGSAKVYRAFALWKQRGDELTKQGAELLNCGGRNAILFLLNEYPAAVAVVFPEFFGSAAFLFLKKAVKIGDIIKAAVIGHFRNGLRCIN